jgi:hypothetical protein
MVVAQFEYFAHGWGHAEWSRSSGGTLEKTRDFGMDAAPSGHIQTAPLPIRFALCFLAQDLLLWAAVPRTA